MIANSQINRRPRRLAALVWFGLLSSVPAIAINDCNHNLIADAADLQSGTSADCNHNGRPDECDVGAVLSFAPPVTLTAGRNARSVAVADFDGDTHLDLAVANFDSNYGSPAEQLSLLFGKGGRAFAAPVTVASGRGTSYVAAADVDGDGDTDLITTNADFDQGHHVGVLLNDGRGHFAAGSRFDTQGAPIFVAARRLDGDDDLDLVLAYAGYLLVSILRNDGRGVFAASESFRVTYEPADVGVADFDADGDLDLAVPIAASDRGVWFYRNRGNATFDRRGRVELSQLYTPSALTVADLNGDGAPDVAVGDHARDSIAILTNNRDETFRIAKTFLIGPDQHGISRLLSGDLDGDGDVDLVVVHPFGGGISIAQNNGHGVFSPPLTLPTGELPLAGTVADLDGDGALDIVVANQTSGTVTLVWNASSAAPAPPVSADCNANRRPDDCEVRARDCNGNGTPDDCDPDADGDGITDLCDICPMANNTTDADRDGVPDCLDGCPYDRDKTDPGACGCGSPEADSDGDGTPTCVDNCPDVPNRDQANQDGDVFGDACDGCRGDAAKVEPETCGCGVPDTDTDFDSLPDCIDRCPLDGTKVKPGRCGCGIPDNLPHCRLPTPTPELTATPTPTATPPPPAAALVVTSTGDEPDALAGDGRCQTATGVCTLRAAVQEANARRGFDRIRVPAGTYPLARGPIEIRDGASLQGAGRDATVVDAGGLAPVLYVAPESALAISDLTLRNGRSSQREGAGGVVNEGTLDMRNCDIRDNSATFDGGTGGMINRGQATLVGSGVLSNSSTNTGGLTNTGTLTLYRTALTDNRGGRYGAALRNLGTAEVVTCELRGNIVFGPADAALYNAAHGRLRIRTSRIVDSLAAAALHNVDGEVVVERTVIAGNSDGGIANYNEFGAAGTVTVTESRIEGNGSLYGGAFGGLSNTGTVNVTASSITGNLSASNGGGLLNSGVMTIVNSTISGNQTGYLGGGISNAGTLELQHVTIAENRSGVGFSPNATGGGLVNASGSSLRIARSIIAGNVDESGTAPDCRGTVESVGANILGDSFGCDWPSGAGDLADVDARLGPLDFYGAPTKSHAVFDNSPAIDAAGPAGKDHCAASDQRGIPRPQGAECDIGAFEATRDCGNGRVDGLERCDLGAGQGSCCTPTCQFAAVFGDCDASGAVSVSEIVQGVRIALGDDWVEACPAFDTLGDGTVGISELVRAVDALLRGCAAVADTARASTPAR